MFFCIYAVAVAQPREVTELIEEANKFFSAAHDATGGVRFGPQQCAKAVPLLEKSIALWEQIPEDWREDEYTQLLMGRCLLTAGDAAGAAARFQYILNKPRRDGEVYVLSDARMALADLLVEGRGINQDRERALALYLLTSPQGWHEARHRDRAAAELLYQLSGSSPLFFQLLERDVPSNWLRSLDIRGGRNGNRYEIARLGIQALSQSKYPEDDDTERAAFRTINLYVGEALHAEESPIRLPAALIYLQRAESAQADLLLESLEKHIPHRLRMPDGTFWSATHD